MQAAADLVADWRPQPAPTWVTNVPSLTHPNLVPDFARRLAQQLELPWLPVVRKRQQNQPQKLMNNSFQQARNLDGAFAIEQRRVQPGAVLLVDDFVDSRWTLTVVAALLRAAGSGPVFPLALALNSLS